MSTYNNADYIQRAIDSVLSQTYANFEYIIINDNSNDATDSIITQYGDNRIVYIKNEQNKGLIHNLNEGLRMAKGTYIARIDSDDWWIDTKKLEKQVAFLEQHTDYCLVGTYARVVDETEKKLFDIISPTSSENIKKALLRKNCFIHSSVLFRKDIAQRCGNYDIKEKFVEDYGLWLRMGETSHMANLSEYSVGYLLNEHGETQKNNIAQITANIQLIKKHKKKYPHYICGVLRWYLKYVLVLVGGLRLINRLKHTT